MFRLDEAVSIHFGRPLNSLRRRVGRIPILMYHSLSNNLLNVHPYYETSTSPDVFRQQLAYLRRAGVKGVSVREAVQRIRSGEPCDAYVAITFDDGYRDLYMEGLPALLQHGFSATVYVIAEKCRTERTHFKRHECLTSAELRHLHNNGIEIGSHTFTHPQLHDLAWRDIEMEIVASKREIENEVGSQVASFCYPYAFPENDRDFVQRFKSTLRDSGYLNAVTTVIGTVKRNSDLFMLPRLPVNTYDDERLFGAKLAGAYDWLHAPQYIIKCVKQFVGRD